jgi:hypothetical protein
MASRFFVALFASCVLLACGQAPAAPAPAPEPPPIPPAAPAPAAAAPEPAALPEVPAGAKVFFVSPAEGATVQGPLENGKVSVTVEMGAAGITIKPAGPVEAGSGHHHLVIDGQGIPAGGVVPKDEQHLHFGKGQTQAAVALVPGPHSLTLQLADGIHRSYGPALAATIKVNVVAGAATPSAPTH